MPQITIKNADRDTVKKVSGKISDRVSKAIGVPPRHIVVEYSDTELFRMGEADTKTAMAWVCWKKRPAEMQAAVSKILAEIFFEEGFERFETIYDNLDMNDFYEYEKPKSE